MTEGRPEPLLVDVRAAARLLGCGRTLVDELIGHGELPVVKLGRLTRIPSAALDGFVADQIAARPPARTWADQTGREPWEDPSR